MRPVSLSRELHSYWVALRILGRYLLHRCGKGPLPTIRGYKPEALVVFARACGWYKTLRYRGEENCPKAPPAVFCANHLKKDDPFITEAAINTASGGIVWVDHMMRDDFFKLERRLWPVDPRDIVLMLGARQISRDGATLSQLREYVDVLVSGASFLMFPTGTRSRSGLCMEYRDGMDEPGGASFFVAQAQKKRPDAPPIPIVPVARTWNPVTGLTMIAFGPPLTLEPGARRADQRELDHRIVHAISDLVEIHPGHAVAGILYLRMLHGQNDSLPLDDLTHRVRRFFASLSPHRLSDPAACSVEDCVTWLARKGALSVMDGAVSLTPAGMIIPEPGESWFAKAPVRWLVNQLLHLPDAVAALEKCAMDQ